MYQGAESGVHRKSLKLTITSISSKRYSRIPKIRIILLSVPSIIGTDSKIRVHIFCCLIGLILTALLRKELLDHGLVMENDALIDKLTKIRECLVFKKTSKNKSGLKIEKHLEIMDDKQTQIWEVISSL